MSAGAEIASPWILLPPAGSVDGTWAHEVAQQVSTGEAIAPSERVLAHYQRLETLDGFAVRVVFAPNLPEAILVSVAAVPAGTDAVADQRALMGLDHLGDFDGQLDDFREVGLEGFQLLRVDSVQTQRSADETVLTATLMTVIRRPLTKGTVDLVAVARSTDLLLVAAAVEPVVELLLGEDLAQLLGG
ncbi:MAG: hypothetical protein ACYC1E_03770 [Propionibacteriaceae bacterium]